MRIKSLKLQNIRSYVEETISFSEGSQLLAGDIGAGKSTVLLAIEYALFGTKRGELETTSLLRNGSHAGRIELTFELHGKEITVSRTLKRTPLSVKQEAGYLLVNNSRIDATPIELRARIIELLGYPKEAQAVAKDLIYRYTVFTPQENMRKIIYDDKEVRLNTLRKVFNIDKYKKIKENAQFIAKEYRAQKRALEETITDLPVLEAHKKKLFEIKEEKEKMRALQEELVKKQQLHKQEKELELAQLEEKALEYRNKKEQHAVLVMQQKAKQALLEQTKQKEELLLRNIAQLHKSQPLVGVRPTEKTVSELEEEKELLEKEISAVEQQYALLMLQEKNYTVQLQQLLKEIASSTQALLHKETYSTQLLALDSEIAGKETAEKTLLALEQEMAVLNKEETTAAVARKNAEDILKRIPLLQNCTLCLQDVTHEHKEKISDAQTMLLQDAMAELLILQQKKLRLEMRMEEQKKLVHSIVLAEKKKAVLQTMLKELSVKEKELEGRQAFLLQLEEQKKQNEEKKKVLEIVSLEQKKEDVAKIRKLLDDLRFWEKSVEYQKNHLHKIAEKEEQLATLKKECVQIEMDLEKIKKELVDYEKILEEYAKHDMQIVAKKQEYEIAREQEKQEEMKCVALQKEVFYFIEQLHQQDALLCQKYVTQEKVRKIQLYHQWLEDFFVPLVSTTEKQVLLQVHASFNAVFTKWFSMLIGEGLTAHLDEDFTPVIEQNGYDTDVLDLSGGEKTAVALAYRLALNKVINDFISTIHTKDLLILDEPTDGFSSEQLDKMRDVLEELQISQLIVVSHEAKIESFVEKIVRIEKQGHVSRVVGI